MFDQKVRIVLGAFNWWALRRFRQSVSTGFGSQVGIVWSLLITCQFHVMFYASRPLPNTFAFFIG